MNEESEGLELVSDKLITKIFIPNLTPLISPLFSFNWQHAKLFLMRQGTDRI